MPLAWFHAYTYSPALIATVEVYPVQMWQHETFIHFGYITVDIIGCVDGKYEHNSADATCQDFAKIPLLSLHCLSLSLYLALARLVQLPRPSSRPLAYAPLSTPL